MRHSADGTDLLPMRKIAIVWVFGLSWIFSVMTLGQPASLALAGQGATDSISAPPSSAPAPTSKKSTHSLIRRPEVSSTPREPSESVAPSTSIRPSHSLIRRPTVPLNHAPGSESTSAGITTSDTRAASAPGNVAAPLAGRPPELPTAKTLGKTSQATSSIGTVAASTATPSPRVRIPSSFANPSPLPSFGSTVTAAQPGTPPGSVSSPRKLTQRPEVRCILPPGPTPSITITSPAANAALPAGPVTVTFNAQDFPICDQGMTHLHFYVDSDTNVYEFFNGITNEVLYPGAQGAHTHFVHWQTSSSIQINGMATGSHQVRFVLADRTHAELTNAEATRIFSVEAPPTGEFQLEPVLTGLSFPVAMAVAPDGRIFYNELSMGQIRIIDPGWQLRPQPFAQLQVATGQEKGLLGIALDPDFANNKFVYVYHTVDSIPVRNRLVRLTEVNGQGTAETVILDNLPAHDVHNGGNIHFGPDGKLYITVGDAFRFILAQDVGFLGGKILRINPDGSIPNDNPFPGSPVYALGLRNSFDFTFHPHTGDLWATENGPEDNDEINRIVAGGNYGWDIVRGIANDPRFVDPLVAFTPVIAPTGIIAVGANSAYPTQYHDNLLFADFNTGRIHRLVLAGATLTQLGTLTVAYTGGQGSLIDLVQGPDGFIYVSSANFFTGIGSIFRVVPPP